MIVIIRGNRKIILCLIAAEMDDDSNKLNCDMPFEKNANKPKKSETHTNRSLTLCWVFNRTKTSMQHFVIPSSANVQSPLLSS